MATEANAKLGVTHCDFCGRRREPLDEKGRCVECQRVIAYLEIHEATGALSVVEAAVREAASGSAHVDDIRACVERAIAYRSGGQPVTLTEMHDRLGGLIDRLAVDDVIDGLEDELGGER
jgi:hypothetical protein